MGNWKTIGCAALAGTILVPVMIPVLLLLVFLGDKFGTINNGAGEGGVSSAVPAEYVEWVLKAGSICPEVSPALIAAQIEAESNWNPNAQSPVGAQGIAQFMPFNAHLIHDEDGNGRASAFDPADAIMAQGRFMCSFVPMFSGSGATGEELTKYLLAAYNAGPGAVLPRGCSKANTGSCAPHIPPYAETQNYVARILSLVGKYQGTAAVGTGAWVHPINTSAVGGTFHQNGSAWRMCGWHTGHDYAAGIGTPVHAMYDGTVVHASWGSDPGGTGSAYGNQVIIKHPNGMRSYYAHLSGFSVTTGQQVKAGQVIGAVGMTGNTFGPHLHAELTKGDTSACSEFVDPHAYIEAHKVATNPVALTMSDTASGDSTVAGVIAAAKQQLGVRYSYGGGSLNGPSAGINGTIGFDCSSLVRYAWYQGSHGAITLPRTSEAQSANLPETKSPQPGDLVLFVTTGSSWSHVGLYLGNGQMIHAPNPRKSVEITNISSGYYANIPITYRRAR